MMQTTEQCMPQKLHMHVYNAINRFKRTTRDNQAMHGLNIAFIKIKYLPLYNKLYIHNNVVTI